MGENPTEDEVLIIVNINPIFCCDIGYLTATQTDHNSDLVVHYKGADYDVGGRLGQQWNYRIF